MHSVSWVKWVVAAAAVSAWMACAPEVVDEGSGGAPSSMGGGTPHATSGKIDLLFVIDNSRSMADKQQILAVGVTDLLGSFTNPACRDALGLVVAQPASPAEPCPAGSHRPFAPIADMHVGVISSSLGSHGSDNCVVTGPGKASVDDKAHLITRSSTDVGAPDVPTYQGAGFLVWDPAATHEPAGEGDHAVLAQNLAAIVEGVGQIGCGFEAPLESMYRFLIEPDPHAEVVVEDHIAVLEGTDQQLLDQRQAFLRPDSVLVVVILSDENDCSIRDGHQFYFAAQTYQPGGGSTQYHLPKARAACATDPNSPCCRSCGQEPGEGCDTSADDCSGSAHDTLDQDKVNMRCWDQKRRFGIDFLYPIDRYLTALSGAEVTDRHGNLVANPLFSGGQRDPSMIYVAGLIGVPWQDVVRRGADGQPDLLGGLDAQGRPLGGFMDGAELEAAGVWDVILGDPANQIPPTDPLMIESWAPRTGLSPIVDVPLAPPGSGYLDNPVKGHEWTIGADDLQYACIFPLPESRDCLVEETCNCKDPSNDNPVCQDPSGSFGTEQYFAKAYPGRRHLSVLEGLGERGIVGSVCAAELHDPDSDRFGYRPALASMASAVGRSLSAP